MTAFMDRHPLDTRYGLDAPARNSADIARVRSFFSPASLETEDDPHMHELVVQVLASLCHASESVRVPPPVEALPPMPAPQPVYHSPSPSPSSPETITFSPPQLLFHQHTVRPSERASQQRHSRERSLSADEERREEEKRERRREKDRVRKRVQREKQRREKAVQARSAPVNIDVRPGHILPPLHAAVALN